MLNMLIHNHQTLNLILTLTLPKLNSPLFAYDELNDVF